jgi:hypothetical protein
MSTTRKPLSLSKRTISLTNGDKVMEGTLSQYDDKHFIFYPNPTPDCFDQDGRFVKVPKTILIDLDGNGENGWVIDF